MKPLKSDGKTNKHSRATEMEICIPAKCGANSSINEKYTREFIYFNKAQQISQKFALS